MSVFLEVAYVVIICLTFGLAAGKLLSIMERRAARQQRLRIEYARGTTRKWRYRGPK